MTAIRSLSCARLIVFASCVLAGTAVPMTGWSCKDGPLEGFEPASGETTLAEHAFKAEDCESEIGPERKREPHSLTEKLSKRFMSEAVRHYIEAQHSAPSPTAMVWPPPEYTDLIAVGKPAVPFLLEQLRSDDELLREAAWQALTEITNKRFISTVDAFGKDRNPDRWQAATIKYHSWWRQNREKSRDQWLIDDVSSPDFITKKTAVIELGFEGDSAAIPVLRKSLVDGSVQFYSVASLARLRDRAAIPYLINLYLAHENEGFRHQGICFLVKLTGQRFEFDPSGTEAARESSIQKWKEWWQSKNRVGDH